MDLAPQPAHPAATPAALSTEAVALPGDGRGTPAGATGPARHHQAFARTRVLAGLTRGGSSLTASAVTTTVSII